MTTKDQGKSSPSAQPPRRGSVVEPRRGGGLRGSHVSRSDRDADPERSADRTHPGSDAGAGPHAQPSLTNEEATPGAGTLPEPAGTAARDDIDVDAATG